ncbi:MAG: glycosyl hydrolase 115 family protein [Pricia sp.]
MYYHFDFVGGPRSYKWLNTVQIERVWEQMRLTYDYGVKEIWLVNVGDLKPMDLPINFFLDFAWNPEKITAGDLPNYYTEWAGKQFGRKYAKEIGEILSLYTKYNARRKPELLESDTYSRTHFNEADRVVEEYNQLLEQAKSIGEKLPKEAFNAYYQLVLYPVEACANMNEMYVAAAKNRLYRMQDRASTNFYADRTKEMFFKDAELTQKYNEFAQGKWNHMMDQTHMGHVSWRDPAVNKMPEVGYIQTKANADMGYMLESGIDSRRSRFGIGSNSFMQFDAVNDQKYYVEIYNKGKEPLDYTISSQESWILISSPEGTVTFEEKIYVTIDWSKVPDGVDEGEINISGAGREFTIKVPLDRRLPKNASGFIENDGIVSIEAVNYHESNEGKEISWTIIPNLGRTGSAITSSPVTTSIQTPNTNSPYLEYEIFIKDQGTYNLEAWFSPALNFQKDEGLMYAFSIDDSDIQQMNLHKNATEADWKYPKWWNDAVTDNIMKQNVMQKELTPGKHSIRYYLLDPGLVLQKILLVKEGTELESYLGPPQSKLLAN